MGSRTGPKNMTSDWMLGEQISLAVLCSKQEWRAKAYVDHGIIAAFDSAYALPISRRINMSLQ